MNAAPLSLETSVARVRKLRDQGILSDEEMHHQIHLLIVAQEEKTPSPLPSPVEKDVAMTPMDVVMTPRGSGSQPEDMGLESEGNMLQPEAMSAVVPLRTVDWQSDCGMFERSFAQELSENALLQLSDSSAGAWQRTSSRAEGMANLGAKYANSVAVVEEAPVTRKGASWTACGFDGEASTKVQPVGISSHEQGGGQGMNMDKRRCRQLHSASFKAAIAAHRKKRGSITPPSKQPLGRQTSRVAGVSAWVRKRPLLPADLSRGEYDAVEANGRSGSVTTHTCLMKPDLRRMYIRHAAFSPPGGVFDDCATSEQVYYVGVHLATLYSLRDFHPTATPRLFSAHTTRMNAVVNRSGT